MLPKTSATGAGGTVSTVKVRDRAPSRIHAMEAAQITTAASVATAARRTTRRRGGSAMGFDSWTGFHMPASMPARVKPRGAVTVRGGPVGPPAGRSDVAAQPARHLLRDQLERADPIADVVHERGEHQLVRPGAPQQCRQLAADGLRRAHRLPLAPVEHELP